MSLVAAVGLSGGVDSAVAAHLLKSQGYEVVGLTMRTWDGAIDIPDAGRSGCYGPGETRDLESAREVARQLGIPHHAIALAPEFRACVLDYFREEYRAGRTPNPCVRCNQSVKFGLLLDKARQQGIRFDLFATGHYARLERENGRVLLKRAADRGKDQSYFLSLLSQEQLGRLLLPLGDLAKAQVKALAASLGWTRLAEKRESQDFIEAKGYGALFSAEHSRPGPILDLSGRRIGEHKGIVHYTKGQRKGMGLGGRGRPLYVVGIAAGSNAIVVGPKEALYSSRFLVRDLNWIALPEAPRGPLRVQVQVRQRHKPASAEITSRDEGRSVSVVCDEPQLSITPGQIAAFYQDDVLLGAGAIRTGVRLSRIFRIRI